MPLTLISALLAAMLLFSQPSFAATFGGRAEAVDGDTLVVAGHKVRLFGIDAPEIDQTCERGGRLWSCGKAAKDLLADLVGTAVVECSVQDIDRYGREVAVCVRRGEDIAALMVRQGGAIAYRKYSARYVNAEAAARREGLGLWAATWISPEDHRAGGRPEQAQAPDAACTIKGNIGRSGKHIYHLPGQADYEATKIDPRKGERWFCSESDARAAGFRRAAR